MHSSVISITRRAMVAALVASLMGFSSVPCAAAPPNASSDDPRAASFAAFHQMRHGIFIHHVYGLTAWPDGRKTATMDEFVDAFDVPAFVEQMTSIGVEYVYFTAWHKAMYNLGPNKALEKWLPGHTAKRDLIGELADALNAKGIKMVIYAHPNDAHDLTKEEQQRVGYIDFKPDDPNRHKVLNEFINEVFAETAQRYASKPNVIGFWWDSWFHNGARIDMPRLRETVLGKFPRAIFLSNYYNGKLNPNFIDDLSLERVYHRGGNLEDLVAEPKNQAFPLLKEWWSDANSGKLMFSPETLYRFLLLNVGTGAPGGACWAVSPLADGKTWPDNNRPMEVLRMLNLHIAPLRPTICGVHPSRNWVLKGSTRWSAAPAFVAARSLTDDTEYIHVLKAPEGRYIDLPKPVESFAGARMYLSKLPVAMSREGDALRLTLPDGERWSGLDTVIELRVDKSKSSN